MDVLAHLVAFTAVAFTAEALFTGIGDQIRLAARHRPLDLTFPCRSSLWAVPVYAVSATVSFMAISAFSPGFFLFPWALRGAGYALGIFAWEWGWGFAAERLIGRCPWRYRDSRHATLRYIRPEYAPFWFAFGFVLEAVHLYVVPALPGA